MPNKITSVVVEKGREDTTMHEGGTISMGPDGIKLYRLLNIKMGMELEFKGIRLTAKAPSCFTIAKKEFGLKGNKKKVYQQFCERHGFEPKKELIE